MHYVKSVQIRSFLLSVFSCIWTEHGDLNSKSLYLDTFHTMKGYYEHKNFLKRQIIFLTRL